ncbi:peroxisome assembly protein (Peroxin-2) [Pleurotus ostreatus]|nr:peroxisome assembly protein (Peroxin-2) [Pleurotus ostreatus]
MSSAPWEDAWDRAQPRLAEIWGSLRHLSSPCPRPMRVGQLDSELLDQELVHVLQEPLQSALATMNPSLRSRFEPELSLIIQLTLYKLSVWNLGATYGAKLQDLKYKVPQNLGQKFAPSGLPRRTLFIHGTLTIVVPYFHARLRSHALSNSWPDAPSSDIRKRLWDTIASLESLHTVLGLFNFVAFLWDGRYRAVTDRLLRMRLVPSRRLVKRDVSYEFMNRQMVWHAFTEFLLFLLPLINARSIRRSITRIVSAISLSNIRAMAPIKALGLGSGTKTPQTLTKRRGRYWTMAADQCAICAENASFNFNISEPTNVFSSIATSAPTTGAGENSENEPPTFPINTPYQASCGDTYCYHCIAERLLRTVDEGDATEGGWECIRCAEIVKTAERVTFIPEEVEAETTSDYEFSSDLDATDMSASVGSFTGSAMSDDY